MSFLISLLFLCNPTSNPFCAPCVRIYHRTQTCLREAGIRMHLAPLTLCVGCVAYGACAGNGGCCFTGCLIGCCGCWCTSDEGTDEERRTLIRHTTTAHTQNQQQNQFERIKKEYEQWKQEFAHILNQARRNQPTRLHMTDGKTNGEN
jgi:hypothetical protein